jgi:hypothetical protein
MPETATRLGEKLSMRELGRDYKAVMKNVRFVAGALATCLLKCLKRFTTVCAPSVKR